MEVIVETVLHANTGNVWKAITDVEQMRKWYFEHLPDFSPEVGFITRFPVKSGERVFTHVWEVTRVIPGREIRYNWSYEEYRGMGAVTFRISPVEREELSPNNPQFPSSNEPRMPSSKTLQTRSEQAQRTVLSKLPLNQSLKPPEPPSAQGQRIQLPDGPGTKLVLIHEGLETFTEKIPEFSIESCRGGWEYFLQEQLPAYLGD